MNDDFLIFWYITIGFLPVYSLVSVKDLLPVREGLDNEHQTEAVCFSDE